MKMELSFDIRGNLKPYEKNSVNFEELKELFVDLFHKDSSRHQLFECYEKYIHNFREKVTNEFEQWINGSFVSNKINPKDIDIVTLIDFQIVEEKESVLRSEFVTEAVSANYGIDAYLLVVYPENHKLHGWTKSDLLYWDDWFTRTKMSRKKKRYPKGYLEINFGK